ncbi:hypothetical protein KXR53_23730, partial [Inquilinus limosus]|uniref:hypothetical protein n=1 Tax=Inquilinus limosus TaxID=171674 RepID=UPI003F139F4E
MSFAGSSVKTPAMAAVHGLRQIAFNTIGDKVLRPLVDYAAPELPQAAAGTANRAQQAAGAGRSAAGKLASAAGGMTGALGSSASSAIAALPELTPQTAFVPPDFSPMPSFDSSPILKSVAERAQQLMAGLPQPEGLAEMAKSMALDQAGQAAEQALGGLLPGEAQHALDTARGGLPGALPDRQQVAGALTDAAAGAVPQGAQDAL